MASISPMPLEAVSGVGRISKWDAEIISGDFRESSFKSEEAHLGSRTVENWSDSICKSGEAMRPSRKARSA
jgi:hypothetical protein